MSIFEKATRMKLRFNTVRGVLNTEDVWDLSLEQLDSLAKTLNKEIKEAEEESFIKSSRVSLTTKARFEVVKHIIDTKLEEAEKSKKAAEKRAHRAKLLEIINRKEQQDLEGKSLDELMKELDALESGD